MGNQGKCKNRRERVWKAKKTHPWMGKFREDDKKVCIL